MNSVWWTENELDFIKVSVAFQYFGLIRKVWNTKLAGDTIYDTRRGAKKIYLGGASTWCSVRGSRA